jgi:hypothetical protein
VVIRTLRLAGLAAVASVATVLASGTAQAGLLSNLVRIDSCDGATLTQPFTPWLDYAYYKLALAAIDRSPGGHSQAVRSSSSAGSLGGALLHDVGKIRIPRRSSTRTAR